MNRLLRLIGLMVLGWVTSCGDVSYDTYTIRYNGPRNGCSNNGNCKSGYGCDPDLHICTLEDGAFHRSLYARIVPVQQEPEIFPIEYTQVNEETVQYIGAKKVGVKVVTDGPLDVASRIFVTDLNGIPGTPPTTRYATVGDRSGNIITGNTAQFTLREGVQQYRVDVIPSPGTEAEDIPPRYFDNVSVEPNPNDPGAHFVDVDGNPMPELYLAEGEYFVRGRILRGTQPAQGLSVQMVEPATGRILSTRDTTGCPDGAEENEVCGEFTLQTVVSMADVVYYLKIWNDSDPAYPTVTVPSTAGVPDSKGRLEFTLSFLSNPVRFGAWVERTVRITGSDEPVHDRTPDCLVVFESNPDSEEMTSVFLNAKTDATGNIVSLNGNTRMYLYPGDYRITIIPPGAEKDAEEDYTLLENTRRIDNSEFNQVFLLNYRYFASLRVQAGGVDIPGAVIEAAPIDPASPYTAVRYSETQSDGSHKIWLDPGRFRLTAKIPQESGYAYAIREIFVEPQGDPSREPVEIGVDDFQVPFPSVAKLHVQTDEDIDLVGATVEWYEQLNDGTTIVIARSTVDSRGDAIGLLPPR